MTSASGNIRRFEKRNRKRFLLIVCYLLAILPGVVLGAHRALQTNATSPLDWVDDRFAPRHEYDQFSDVFGTADAVILSWPGCTIDETSLDRFTSALQNAPAFRDGDRPYFHRVTSGREQIDVMTSPPISMDVAEAVDRLRGSLIGPDGQTTCVVIAFTEQGLKQRSRLVPLIRAAATKHCQVPRDQQHLAGPIMDGYEVDRATRDTLDRLAPLSAAVVLVVCYLCVGSARGALLIFLLSLFCQGITLATVHFGGGTMTALMAVLGPLVQVLAIAGGIHFVNYYFDSQATTPGHDAALAEAFRLAWLPCLLSAATTAIGLGSLGVSGLVAVREFGLYAAFGVMVTAALLLTLLPGFFRWLPIPRPRHFSSNRSDRIWSSLAGSLSRRATWVTGIAFAAMAVLGIGVTRLNASVRIETLFPGESRLIKDYAWLEENVGALVPIEVVVGVDPQLIPPERQIDVLHQVEQELKEIGNVNAVLSSLTFLPTNPGGPRTIPVTMRLTMAREIGEQFDYFAVDHDGLQRWRTTAYVSALGKNDYVQIMAAVERALGNETDVDIQVSGLMPLVHEIQTQLLDDLFRSFLTAFALIAVVMTIVQAGVLAGLLSMIPNVFPALTLFGLIGWTGRPLDIGTIMTASVAMGIAVDDTLHFLTFYQRELEQGRTRAEAVLASYQHCGRAMIQTTIICSSGLALFGFSSFVPTSGFAWMSVLLLTAALVGDLIVLPAVLLSPLGKGTVVAPVTDRSLEVELSPVAEQTDWKKPRNRPAKNRSNLETSS